MERHRVRVHQPAREPLSPYSLIKQWHIVRVRPVSLRSDFHDLRHTAVSLLLALGVPPHVVREIVGHSEVKVTMTDCAHGHLAEKAAALAQLGTAVAGALPSAGPVEPRNELTHRRAC